MCFKSSYFFIIFLLCACSKILCDDVTIIVPLRAATPLSSQQFCDDLAQMAIAAKYDKVFLDFGDKLTPVFQQILNDKEQQAKWVSGLSDLIKKIKDKKKMIVGIGIQGSAHRKICGLDEFFHVVSDKGRSIIEPGRCATPTLPDQFCDKLDALINNAPCEEVYINLGLRMTEKLQAISHDAGVQSEWGNHLSALISRASVKKRIAGFCVRAWSERNLEPVIYPMVAATFIAANRKCPEKGVPSFDIEVISRTQTPDSQPHQQQ